MKKLYIKRIRPEDPAWHNHAWRWWYVAYGEKMLFKRFGHGGWICLQFSWLKRYWNFDGPRAECAKSS